MLLCNCIVIPFLFVITALIYSSKPFLHRARSDIGSLLDDPPQQGPIIRLLLPIWGKSNELNSSHNILYFVDCPQSRGKVLCLLSIELT